MMQIWLKQGKQRLRLPVLPSGFDVGTSQKNTTVDITSFGEINLIGKRGLKTLPLSSFFPSKQYGFVQYKGFPKPYECVKLILSWMDDPITVVITGTNINMQATIESFNYSEKDSTGDVSFTLELKEYRKPKVVTKKVTVNKKSTKIVVPASLRKSKKYKSCTYVVKNGDTLSSIAKKLTGSSSNIYAISNQNKIKNVNKLKVGLKLVIKI